MMDIVFGLRMDGGAWPEHGGEGAGAVGAPVVGPLGLIEILEHAGRKLASYPEEKPGDRQ